MPIGDVFYPDNPKRRVRAAQLANDIKAFGVEFDQLKKLRDETAARLKPKLDELFKRHGLNNQEEIEKKIQANLSSAAMREYQALKDRLTLTDQVETVVMGIIDFFAAISGVVLTIGVIAGIATAGAALLAVGEVLAVLGILVIVVGIIQGSEEREELRHTIASLREKRIDIQICVGQMQAVTHWLHSVEAWLETVGEKSPDVIDTLMKTTLAEEYKQWTRDFAREALVKWDASRDSWTDEDYWQDPPSVGEILEKLPIEFMPVGQPILIKM